MTYRTKSGILSICLFVFSISCFCQQAAYNQNSSRSNHTIRSSETDVWNFGINTGTSFGINSNETTLFRGNSLATKMFGGYYLGKFGLGISGGFIPGKLSEGSINNFIAERNYQQSPVTSSDPFNGYLMFGPTVKFGERIKVLAELQGGMFLNNPGSMTVGQAGAVRPLYRYEAGSQSLFPGFSGNINLTYPLNSSTTFFINSEYLQTKSSIVIYDPKNGIDIPTEQNRDVKLMNFGIGISKSFGRREQASGIAAGKSNVQFNPKEYTVTKKYQPGQPVYGNRTTNESCGPVTMKTTNPDGSSEEMTFACPDDAVAYAQRKGDYSERPVWTSSNTKRTFILPHVLEKGGIIHRNLAARNIIAGRAVWTSSNPGMGITTNKTIITGSSRGGSLSTNSQTSSTRTTPNNSFGTLVRLSARESSSGMATGRRQYEPVFMEGQASVCNPCLVTVNNPVYQQTGAKGDNPFYEDKARVSNPDWADLNPGIEGLTVSLVDILTGTVVAVTQTEKNGDFFFANVPDGYYAVKLNGVISGKKDYEFNTTSKTELEGNIVWSGETVQVILNTESADDNPSMRAGISTSRSNLRTKTLTIIDADTDGDGSCDTFTVLGDISDGRTFSNSGDVAVSRVNKIDAFTIKQAAMKMPGSFASKLGGVAKGIQLTRITISGEGSADATFSDGSTLDITNAVAVAASANVKQYTVAIGDLDGDGAADMVLRVTKTRSNIQNNRLVQTDDNGEQELSVIKTKTKSNQSNDRLKNEDENEEAGVIKTKTKSNQSNDRMMAGDEMTGEIWSPRSNRAMYEVMAADLDGDGKPELVTKVTKSRSNIQNNRIMVADVDGDGLQEVIINTSRFNINNLVMLPSDVDGDGKTDLKAGVVGGAIPGGNILSSALRPGDPIPGIDVKLKRKSATSEKLVDSYVNGLYRVIGPDMEPDTYLMTVTANIYIDDEIALVVGDENEITVNEEGLDKKAASGIKQTMQTQVKMWNPSPSQQSAINTSHINIKNLLATINEIEQMLEKDNTGSAASINTSHSNIKNLQAAATELDNTLNNIESIERDAAMTEVKNNLAAMNMQFLALQESLQNAGRQYTTVSNVLKTRHDTVKNSIGNIR